MCVVRDRIGIKGGYNKRAESAACIEYQSGDTTHVFVELDKNAPWFLKGVGGPKIQKGDLKPVQVIQLLRERFLEKLGGRSSDDAAVAEGDSPAVAASQSEDDNIDPMDAMDAMDEVAVTVAEVLPQKKAPKPKPPTRDVCRALAHELEVPARPPCAGGDKGEKTIVYIYKRPGCDKRSNGNLYLRTDSIEWLLAYAADELAFQGVESGSPDPSPTQACNCPAVADLHLEWDFNAKAWEGQFVAGPLVGTTKCMSVKELNHGIWEGLKDNTLVQSTFGHCKSPLEKKSAVKDWVTMWCAAVARNESAEFDAIMGSLATSSPGRGEKRPLEDPHHTAVAAKEDYLAEAAVDTAVAAPSWDEEDGMMG
jgi:hypothetical protein